MTCTCGKPMHCYVGTNGEDGWRLWWACSEPQPERTLKQRASTWTSSVYEATMPACLSTDPVPLPPSMAPPAVLLES